MVHHPDNDYVFIDDLPFPLNAETMEVLAVLSETNMHWFTALYERRCSYSRGERLLVDSIDCPRASERARLDAGEKM